MTTLAHRDSAASRYIRLSGVDAFMLGLDRESVYNQTLKIAILDPSTDPDGYSFAKYRAELARQVARGSLLTKRYLPTPFGIHQPIWVDDPDFGLDDHLRRIACPAPGGMKELCALIAQVMAHPLCHSRPLWQVWVVEGLEGGRVAIVGLIHHAYMDGAGARDMIENMTSTTPTDIEVGETPDWNPAPLPSKLRRIGWAVRDLPAVWKAAPPALVAIRERHRLERDFAASGASSRPSARDRREAQPFAGSLTRSRGFACDSFSLSHLRDVGKSLGGTVNDVFLSCVAGSVREFLARRGETPQRPIIGTLPFLSKPVTERSRPGGNFSSADDMWLHVEIADPVERLAATRVSAQATKDHFKAVSAADPFLVLFDLMPGWALRAVLRFNERTEGRFTPAYDIAVSNVPGPTQTMYFGRWRVEHFFSTGQLIPGMTLNLTAWSYDGQFNVCLLAGSPQISDAWEVLDGVRASLEELRAVAAGEASRGTAAAEGGSR